MKLKINSCDGIYESLDVRFTKACDNNCAFCIERKGVGARKQASSETLSFVTVLSGIKEVLILGGEPFLQPKKLLDYVNMIQDNVEKIYITTSLPETFYSETETIRKILRKIDGLNVSLQHYDDSKNNDLLGATSRHNRIAMLMMLNSMLWLPYTIRTSINLVKGYIDSKEEIAKCIGKLKSIGCRHIKINELQGESDLYVSYEDIMGIRLPSPYAHGCQTDLPSHYVGRYGEEVRLTLKRSCFAVEQSRKASFMDLVKVVLKRVLKPRKKKFAVLYENGDLEYHWKQKEYSNEESFH